MCELEASKSSGVMGSTWRTPRRRGDRSPPDGTRERVHGDGLSPALWVHGSLVPLLPHLPVLLPAPPPPSQQVVSLPFSRPRILTGARGWVIPTTLGHPGSPSCQAVAAGLRTRVKKAGVGNWMVSQRGSCAPSDITCKMRSPTWH